MEGREDFESRSKGVAEDGAHHGKPEGSVGDSAHDSGQGVLGVVKSSFQGKLPSPEDNRREQVEGAAGAGVNQVIDSVVTAADVPPSPFAGFASKSPFPAGQHCCDMSPSETASGVMKAGENKRDKSAQGPGSQAGEASSNVQSGKGGKSADATGAVNAAEKSASVLPVSDGGPSGHEDVLRPVSNVEAGPAGAFASVQYETKPTIVELARDVLNEVLVLLMAVLEGFWPWLMGQEPHAMEPLDRLREAWFGSS